MPFIQTSAGPCYYRLDGPDALLRQGFGGQAAPVVVLSHALGLDHGMWDVQAADLLPYFRVLRYDTRGHGASAAPAGDYALDDLGGDVLALTDALGIDRFSFCGLSMGGMVGQWLALNTPERLTRLVLANTTARLTDPAMMETRRAGVLAGGIAAIVDAAMGRFFSPAVLAGNAPAVASARRTLLATSPVGYAGCCAAIRDMDFTSALGRITTPTLVLGGDLDVSMPWPDHGGRLAASIPGAVAVRLPAAHLSSVERPRSFSAALFSFLLPAAGNRLEAGERARRAVLGDTHVDRSIQQTTALNQDFQTLLTEYAWGTIWTRPGLDHRTRRLLVLTATAALGRWEEFRLHLRAGLAHELEWPDVTEVLLQAAVYAGVPAANTGFQIAAEEMRGTDGQVDSPAD
jgi:3-oxoadipate enol-lactonase/4-carboxymuconolactone decarboxylase